MTPGEAQIRDAPQRQQFGESSPSLSEDTEMNREDGGIRTKTQRFGENLNKQKPKACRLLNGVALKSTKILRQGTCGWHSKEGSSICSDL